MKRRSIYQLAVIKSNWLQQIAEVRRYFYALSTLENISLTIGNTTSNANNSYQPTHLYSHVTSLTAQALTTIYNAAVMVLGEQYKQCNAEFTAVYCTTLSKPSNTLHGDNIVTH